MKKNSYCISGLLLFCVVSLAIAGTIDTVSGVKKITAGTNITISPTGGQGNVTVNGSSGTVAQLTAGTNITLSPVGGTGAVTINSTSSLPETATGWIILGSGGDIQTSTSPFVAVSDAFFSVPPQSTFTVTGISAYVNSPSTITYSAFKVAWSSSTGATIEWQYITNEIICTTSTKSSVIVTPLTGVMVKDNTLYSGDAFAVHISSGGNTPAGATLASNWRVILQVWWKTIW